MATIKIDERGNVTDTMANGTVIPVPADYGAEWWFTDYRPELVDGLSGDIEDGETFTPEDEGCAWTRYGSEMLSTAPGHPRKLAA